ncbi:MAG: ABC transporter ATP-binding protein [Microbacteriaceae bacterium]|nr:ABC transporter ATP-binding protein [Microbacteriaceae bacterium]
MQMSLIQAPASEATGETALDVQAISLSIGGARILENVSLTVAKSEMIGVIGPNGAGKTTLFNIISGVMKPTAGRIELSGKDITKNSIAGRASQGLGRTFQTSSLFPALSVLENVRLAAQAKIGGSLSIISLPTEHDEATDAAWEALKEVELDHRSQLLAGTLSHGDKRKLEIAMILVTKPNVILLDEPMAGVGSGDVPGLMEIIRSLHKDHGNTVLIVEHHMEVVLGLVDRVAVMHHGSLLAIDTPENIVNNPVVQSAYLGEAL